MKRIITFAAAAVLSGIAALSSAEAVPAAQGMSAAPQTGTALQRVHYRGGPNYGWYRGPHYGYYRGPNVAFAYWRGPRYRSYYRAGFYGAGYYSGGYYTPVGYPACRAWARECAERWGWRTWRWGRCMGIHAC